MAKEAPAPSATKSPPKPAVKAPVVINNVTTIAPPAPEPSKPPGPETKTDPLTGMKKTVIPINKDFKMPEPAAPVEEKVESSKETKPTPEETEDSPQNQPP